MHQFFRFLHSFCVSVPVSVSVSGAAAAAAPVIASMFLVSAPGQATESVAAIRNKEITETEFLALAKALNHIPIAEFLGARDPDEETLLQFRNLLIEAQTAWIGDATNLEKIEFINKFLNLRTLTDWSINERRAFVTFLFRRSEIEPETAIAQTFSEIDSIVLDDSELIDSTISKQFLNWGAGAQMRKRSYVSFNRQLFSDDYTLVRVNGLLMSRARFANLKVPSMMKIRLTALSNGKQPIVTIDSAEVLSKTIPPQMDWVSGPCQQAHMEDSIHKTMGSAKLVILGADLCQNHIGKQISRSDQIIGTDGIEIGSHSSAVSSTEATELSRFGLSGKSDRDSRFPWPASDSEEHAKPFYQNPWVWAAVGAIVVGGLAYANQENNRNEPVPVHRVGWP